MQSLLAIAVRLRCELRGRVLYPAVSHFLLDQLLKESWIAFCLRPIALTVQQVRPLDFQVVIIQVVLALSPLHAGRNVVKDACRDAMLQQVSKLRVGVLHACGKGWQKVETERLSGSHEQAVWL